MQNADQVTDEKLKPFETLWQAALEAQSNGHHESVLSLLRQAETVLCTVYGNADVVPISFLYALGKCHLESNHYPEAESALRQALKNDTQEGAQNTFLTTGVLSTLIQALNAQNKQSEIESFQKRFNQLNAARS